jgi:hypothetical protein
VARRKWWKWKGIERLLVRYTKFVCQIVILTKNQNNIFEYVYFPSLMIQPLVFMYLVCPALLDTIVVVGDSSLTEGLPLKNNFDFWLNKVIEVFSELFITGNLVGTGG